MPVSPTNMPMSQTRRALKRSASTASLPTPPRTHSRRRRRRSGGSCDSDSDEHEGLDNQEGALSSTDEEDNELPQHGQKGRKKRRLSRNDDDEEAFWVARPESELAVDRDQAKANASETDAREPSSSAPLLYRKSLQRSRSQSTNGLASPPPSHRKRQAQAPATPADTAAIVVPNSNPTSPPATPKRQIRLSGRAKAKGAKIPQFPIISDSPDNPFYDVPASPSPGEDSESPRVSTSPRTPGTSNYHEKPTVTYVFRGVRREYQNPLYNHAKNRPLSPPPNSLLPIEHPDYSPDMACKPTVLFPNAHKGKRAIVGTDATAAGPLRRSPRRKGPVVGDSEDEDDSPGGIENPGVVEGDRIRPRRLDFGPPKNTGKIRTTKITPPVGGDAVL